MRLAAAARVLARARRQQRLRRRWRWWRRRQMRRRFPGRLGRGLCLVQGSAPPRGTQQGLRRCWLHQQLELGLGQRGLGQEGLLLPLPLASYSRRRCRVLSPLPLLRRGLRRRLLLPTLPLRRRR